MYDKLKRINITYELIERIAIIKFGKCTDDFVWDDLSDMDKGEWLNKVAKSLNEFNSTVNILNNLCPKFFYPGTNCDF